VANKAQWILLYSFGAFGFREQTFAGTRHTVFGVSSKNAKGGFVSLITNILVNIDLKKLIS